MRRVQAPVFAYYLLGETLSSWVCGVFFLCFFCVFFYSDAVNVNVERSNGAASRPHKERGNRISPSGERSKTKLFFFFFLINFSAVKQLLRLGLSHHAAF